MIWLIQMAHPGLSSEGSSRHSGAMQRRHCIIGDLGLIYSSSTLLRFWAPAHPLMSTNRVMLTLSISNFELRYYLVLLMFVIDLDDAQFDKKRMSLFRAHPLVG